MKIVINRCFGGFGLSDECSLALGGQLQTISDYLKYYIFPNEKKEEDFRTSPELINLMETKGSEWCSGRFSELKIVEIPDDVDYIITEYDGLEQVEEVHRVWF